MQCLVSQCIAKISQVLLSSLLRQRKLTPSLSLEDGQLRGREAKAQNAKVAAAGKTRTDVQRKGLLNPDPTIGVRRGCHVLQVPAAAQVHALSFPQLEGLPPGQCARAHGRHGDRRARGRRGKRDRADVAGKPSRCTC